MGTGTHHGQLVAGNSMREDKAPLGEEDSAFVSDAGEAGGTNKAHNIATGAPMNVVLSGRKILRQEET